MKDKKTLWAIIIWWALYCVLTISCAVENYQDEKYFLACIDSGCFGAGLYLFFDYVKNLIKLIRDK